MGKKGKAPTSTTLPNGTLITTVEQDGRRVWGSDGTSAQVCADMRWLFGHAPDDNGAGSAIMADRSAEIFPWEVCIDGMSKAILFAENYARGTVLTSWIKGESPDLPQSMTVADLDEMAAGEGYAKGVERLAEFSAKLSSKVPVPESIRGRYKWSDEGDDYDVIRTYGGDFEHAFGGWKPAAYRGPRTVTLYITVGGNSAEDWQKMFWRAASGVAVADVLTKAGFNVEIYGLFCSGQISPQTYTISRTLVKRAGDFANLSTIAFATSLTAYFRQFGFRLHAFNPWEHGWGWGMVQPPKNCKAALNDLGWLGDTGSTAVLFNEGSDEASAMKAAEQALKEIAAGIDLELEGIGQR